jgi:hydrogenase-4 component B
MTVSVVWSVVPLAPLGFALMLALSRQQRWTDALIKCLWSSSIPAFVALILGAQNLRLPALWASAQWGIGNSGPSVESLVDSGWLLFTSVLWTAAAIYAADMLKHDGMRKRFFVFWLLAFSGNLLLVIAQDTLSFYVGFSMMSLAAYGLIVHERTSQARRAGRLYLQLAISGEILLFIGIILLAHALGGITTFDAVQSAPLSPLTVLLLLTGLGLKAGFWPLHVWLPQAHPVAPAPASAVLSGVMIKAGILGLWRFLPGQSMEAGLLQSWAPMLLAVGIFSAFYGVVLGLTRSAAKEVLAYSSVSQMGYLLIIIALAWYSPMPQALLGTVLLLYATHHAYCKGALFIAADIVRSPSPRSAFAARLIPILIFIPALALAALPLTSGAAVKVLLKESMEVVNLAQWTPWLSLGAFASVLVLMRAAFLLLQSWQQNLAQMPSGQTGQKLPLSLQKFLPWMFISLLPVVLPWLWPEMRAAFFYSLSMDKLLELLGPLGMGLGLSILAIHYKWALPDSLAKLPNPLLPLSLSLKRLLQNPPVPSVHWILSYQQWRDYERRWNRFWHGSTINHSTALLLLFLFSATVFLLLIAPAVVVP